MATSRRKSPPKRRRAPLPPWLLLGGGLIAGIASTMLYDGVRKTDWNASLKRFAFENGPVDLPEHEFEFYTLLRGQEFVVSTPEPKAKPVKPPAKQPRMAPSETGAYYLQVGSFRERSAADAMRARVTLLGTRGSIQQVQHNQNTWYRVRVGPYEQVNQVGAVQAKLKQHQINALLVRAKP